MPRAVFVVLAAGFLAGWLEATAATPPRFYPDDPLVAEPRPLEVAGAEQRALSAPLEALTTALSEPGQRHPEAGVIAARGVNTLGEVMDGDWYVNRHGARAMTLEELQRGSGDATPPATTGAWQVLVVKRFGTFAGMLVADARSDLYLLRFDPPGYVGLATGAQMVASRFLHALGYFVGEDYLVQFVRSRLVASPEGQAVSSSGRHRALVPEDIDAFFNDVPRGAGGVYRAVATRMPGRRDTLLGPYQMWGERSDDPNDVVPHEHRRDLRGLSVFAAWLNIAGFGGVGTQDALVTVDGVSRVRHYIIDLAKALGNSVTGGPKPSWVGNETQLPSLGTILRNIASLGVVTPAWMRETYPGLREVGSFGSRTFDPAEWTARNAIAPFVNRLPDDAFWAARQVMRFSDEEIRAIVRTGQYSQRAEDWITAALIERRNRIGRTFYADVLPLDTFRIADGALRFDDLAVNAGFSPPRTYRIAWNGFDNASNALTASLGEGPQVPAATGELAAGSYVAARIDAGDDGRHVMIYFRRHTDGLQLVGIDRSWPGRNLVDPPAPARADRRVFEDLAPRQRELFATYAQDYNRTRGSQYSVEEVFERLTMSEQTTFYGVTHALLHSALSDAGGESLGLAIDHVTAVERIAGQYPGRGGDEQFRLYVRLKPDTRDVLQRSREFFLDHENTVYHIGYPHSFRQGGKEPSMQFSISEDGLRADIDVDYRSSRSPRSLFNGHLTAANSDVRAGQNTNLHNGRWQGLIAWWQDLFGRLRENEPRAHLLELDRPDTAPTPLPPDRPADYAAPRVEDAAAEFLADWLVRREYDDALAMVSAQAFACLTLTDDGRRQSLDAAGARRELMRLMEYTNEEMGPRSDLTSAIAAVTLRDPKRQVIDHPFRREFVVTPLPASEAQQYLCRSSGAQAPAAEYYAVVFTFRADGGGTLGLLWGNENGQWKLMSYRLLSD